MPLFSVKEKGQIKSAIQKAEHRTSGEIRVCVEATTRMDPVERAGQYFIKLDMHKTALRNGVLIYIAYEDKKFAIIGDQGIHQKVGPHFWEQAKNTMTSHFKNGQMLEGVLSGVAIAGYSLKKFFPHQRDDKNELPDDVFEGDSSE